MSKEQAAEKHLRDLQNSIGLDYTEVEEEYFEFRMKR